MLSRLSSIECEVKYKYPNRKIKLYQNLFGSLKKIYHFHISNEETMAKYTFPVYEFRPLVTGRKLLRFNNGDWIEDDGEYDLAFITDDNLDAPFCYYIDLPYKKDLEWSWVKDGNWGGYVSAHPNGNPWHYQYKGDGRSLDQDWNRSNHPNIKAGEIGMNKTSKKYSCANGRSASFEIGDPYILAGLLREKSSKRVIKFPNTFRCVYCGVHDLSKLELSKQHP